MVATRQHHAVMARERGACHADHCVPRHRPPALPRAPGRARHRPGRCRVTRLAAPAAPLARDRTDAAEARPHQPLTSAGRRRGNRVADARLRGRVAIGDRRAAAVQGHGGKVGAGIDAMHRHRSPARRSAAPARPVVPATPRRRWQTTTPGRQSVPELPLCGAWPRRPPRLRCARRGPAGQCWKPCRSWDHPLVATMICSLPQAAPARLRGRSGRCGRPVRAGPGWRRSAVAGAPCRRAPTLFG